MGISSYDMVLAAVIVAGAVIGYVFGFLKMFRSLISLILSRYLFVYLLARFTGMAEIKVMIRKMISTGVDKLVISGKIPSDVALKLSGTKQLISAEEMFAGYIASAAVFAVTFIAVRLLLGLIITTVTQPKNKALYVADKAAGFAAGAAVAVAVITVAFMVIMSMAYVGSPWAAKTLQGISETVIYRYATQFI